MADNTTYTPAAAGAGTINVAVDNCTVNSVANTGVPLGKVGFGGNDVWTYVTSTVGLPVNLNQVGGSAFALGQGTMAASIGVAIASNQSAIPAAQSGTWNIGTVTTVTTVAAVTAITNALPAGTNTIGVVAPVRGTMTDGSSTITAGGSSQQVFATNATRSYLLIVNTSNATLWFNWTTAAVQSQPSIPLTAGASYELVGVQSTEAINIIGATTGLSYSAKQL